MGIVCPGKGGRAPVPSPGEAALLGPQGPAGRLHCSLLAQLRPQPNFHNPASGLVPRMFSCGCVLTVTSILISSVSGTTAARI